MKRTLARILTAAAALVLVAATSTTANAAGFPNPVYTGSGVADPGTVLVGDTYYVASTSNGVAKGMPVLASTDRLNWTNVGAVFSDANLPAWSDASKGYWAPEIYYLPAVGSYVAYFSAINTATGKRCLGRATSATPYDFTDLGRPFLCHSTGAYSVIDQSLFTDPQTGQLYLLYKDDPVSGKRLVVRSVNADGLTSLGAPHHLGPSLAWEGDSVEGPTMVFQGGHYYLFYSGATYSNDNYAVGVARASSPTGPFTKDPAAAPILSGDRDAKFCGVGHQNVTYSAAAGWVIWYHAYTAQSGEGCTGQRYLMMDRLNWNRAGGWPSVHDGTPSE